MKQILQLIIGLLIITMSNHTSAQDPEWLTTISCHGQGNSMTSDSLGNIYTTGQFYGQTDFDPGPGTFNLLPVHSDIFIQKLDANGNFLWAKSIGSASFDNSYSITNDKMGNIYITGFVGGDTDFDPGPGTALFTLSHGVNYFVLKLDANGNFLWAKVIDGMSTNKGKSIAVDKDNNVLIIGSFQDPADFDPGPGVTTLTPHGSSDVFIQKLDQNGNFLWAKSFGGFFLDRPNYITTDTFGNVYTTGSFAHIVDFDPGPGIAQDTGNHDIFIHKLDPNGNFLWVKTMKTTYLSSPSNRGTSVRVDRAGNVYSTGFFKNAVDFDPGPAILNIGTSIIGVPAQEKLFVQKLDPSGNLAWVKTLEEIPSSSQRAYGMDINEVGDVYITGEFDGSPDFNPGFGVAQQTGQSVFILKLDASGNFLWVNSFGGSPLSSITKGFDIMVAATNHVYITGEFDRIIYLGDTLTASSLNDIFILKLKDFSNFIQGNVYHDFNFNCVKDSSEQPLDGFIVEATNVSTNLTYYGTTDLAGNYSIAVDTGNYIVTPIISPYWTTCTGAQSIHIVDSLFRNYPLNFDLQALISCPLLQVDISAPFLRSTSSGSFYSISYCNTGTTNAINASVEVNIDPFLNVLSTSIPIASQVGNVYTFNLDTVPINTCHDFQIQVLVDTSAIFAQTICTDVHITPDSICIPNFWNGPIIDPIATCRNDTIFFKLHNIGLSPFSAQDYYVFEDHIIMNIQNSGTINNGDSLVVVVPADTGKTYRIMIPQAAGFPPLLGNQIATVAIEGCLPDSSGIFHTNFMTQFSNGSSSPFEAIDCQPAIGAFDPNDKAAQPLGYGPQHYIEDFTALDYKIRFQNTGTDTAFNIVIIDTISSHLDVSSIQMGASSHPYTWTIKGQNVLEITFNPIELPDSNVNELASHGFVRFRIDQKTGNPIGATINNTANIYFDYNPPIVTNTTWHIVDEDFTPIDVSIDQIYSSEVVVKVFPNPFKKQTTIAVEGGHFQTLKLSVFDVMGRLVQTKAVSHSNQLLLQRGNLNQGLYVYRLEGDGKLIGTGKIILHN